MVMEKLHFAALFIVRRRSVPTMISCATSMVLRFFSSERLLEHFPIGNVFGQKIFH
jgi:hypothetical protein